MTRSQSAEEDKARSCSETRSIFINSPGRDVHFSSSFSGRHMYWSLQAASFGEAAQQSWSHLSDVLVSPGNNYTAKSRTYWFYPLLPSDPSRIHFLCLCWKSSYSSFHVTFPPFLPNWQAIRTSFFPSVITTVRKSRETAMSIGQGASFGGVWRSWAQQCHRPLLAVGSKPPVSHQYHLARFVD